MTKTLSLKASKKLQEYIPEGLRYYYDIEKEDITENPNQKDLDEWYYYKTLTLEEAIEMLPSYIYSDYYYEISKEQWEYYVSYEDVNWDQVDWDCVFIDASLIHAIEQMLLYLADNNLLK